MKSAISRASSSITASTGLSDSAQIVRGGSNLTTVGAIPYVQSSGVLTQSAGLTFTDAANIRLATLAGGSSQSTNALLDVTNSAGTGHHLTVLGDGKVGVGTNAPSVRLHALSSGEIMRLETSTARGSGLNYLSFNDPTGQKGYQGYGGGTDAYYVWNGMNGLMQFGTNNIARVTIASAGSVGIGTSNTTPANATLSILDATPSTGSTATWVGHDGSGTYSGVHLSALATSLKVVAGLTQSTTNLVTYLKNDGTTLGEFRADGSQTNATLVVANGDPTTTANWRSILDQSGFLTIVSGGKIGWVSSATSAFASPDTSLSRIGAGGIIGGGTGSAGSVAGAFQATKYISAGTAFITWGTGTPEAAVTATVGSVFLRTDGGAATVLYVKESGSGNTGWIAK